MFRLLNGGLELGLQAVVGGTVAWHAEVDKHPAAVLAARFPGVPNLGDITTTDWAQVEPVDWFTAGYPCQPFSHAGKRKGSADERHLWPFVADAVRVLRPRRVLLENVRGHLSLGLADVLADLSGMGYDATWGVVRAADAGAPHGRARVFVVAADTGWNECGERPRLAGVMAGEEGPRTRQGSERERHGDATRDRGAAVAHPDEPGRQGGEPAQGRLLSAWGAPADTASDGRDEGRPELAGIVGRPHAAERGDDAVADADAERRQRRWVPRHGLTGPADNDVESALDWGTYGPAIRRWEAVTGRAAPRPTEPGRTGERLSPRFVEWLMGLPAGWVTDILPRAPALKCLGNGVVPQQAALAVRTLLNLQPVAA